MRLRWGIGVEGRFGSATLIEVSKRGEEEAEHRSLQDPCSRVPRIEILERPV